MATPMTASQLVAQLKKWGIKYVEVSVDGVSWKTTTAKATAHGAR
jgi:hypothetical protein